jgi:FkbM family methyltransferase
MATEVIGEHHGAWRVPADCIRPGMVCYCVGVGEEASFDLTLAKRGAQVYSFDPTPNAISYINRLDIPPNLTFMPLGVWNKNETLEFYLPEDGEVNLSVKNVHLTKRCVKAECRTLASIMKELGHTRIDLLKVDVEGAWAEIVRNVIDDKIPVGIFCVEFDSPTSVRKATQHIDLLARNGYELCGIDRDNFLFVNRRFISSSQAAAEPASRPIAETSHAGL